MSHKYNISLVTGDGIGPEISESALSILEAINDNFSLPLEIKKLEAGAVSYTHLTLQTILIV